MALRGVLNPRHALAGVLLAAALAGCAAMPETDGRVAATSDITARGRDPGDADAPPEPQAALAGRVLDRDTAVRLALTGNPGLEEDYARLGFAAADVYEAARPRNPAFGLSVMSSDEDGAADQVGVGISLHLTDLLMLGAKSRLAQAEYVRVRQTIAARALDVAADAESAWVGVVAAQQGIAVREAIARAASTSAGLAQRVFDAGNISRLDLALEKAAAAEAALALMDARAGLVAARASLNRVMGLGPGDESWRVPHSLPGLPETEAPVRDLLMLADRSRIDLAAARDEVTSRAQALELTRTFRLLGDVDAGISTERETDRSRITGPEIGLQLPLFDRGTGRVARARAALAQSEARLRALEVDISATVRAESERVGAARERANHYREVLIPLREQIVGLMQQKVNFMLDDPARLILARKEEYEAYDGYLAAVRDYWLARAALTRAVSAVLPGDRGDAAAPVAADLLIAPDDAGAPGHRGMRHQGGAGHEDINHERMGHEGMDHDPMPQPEAGEPSADPQSHRHHEEH